MRCKVNYLAIVSVWSPATSLYDCTGITLLDIIELHARAPNRLTAMVRGLIEIICSLLDLLALIVVDYLDEKTILWQL